eukprot:15365224-Ditylum_brightwellii.AAC.1
MDEETVDEQVYDASTQGRAVGNDGSPPEEISINESNQDADDDSLQTLSDLLLTKEPFLEVKVGQFHNLNYLKKFFKVPPNSFGRPPVPTKKEKDTSFHTLTTWIA